MGLRSEEGSQPGREIPLTPPPAIPRPSQLRTSHGRLRPKFSKSALRLYLFFPGLGSFFNHLVQEGVRAGGNDQ